MDAVRRKQQPARGGSGEALLVCTWLGVSSGRGRFGDIGHRRVNDEIVHLGGVGGRRGGERRSMNDPIGLLVVVLRVFM